MLAFYKVGHVQQENASISLVAPGRFLGVGDCVLFLSTFIQQVLSECGQSQVSSLHQGSYPILKSRSIEHDKCGTKCKEENIIR